MTALTRVARLDEDGNDTAYITLDLDSLDNDERTQVRVLGDDEDAEPLDRYGRARETTYPTLAEVDGEPVDRYSDQLVSDLREEVATRNAERAEGDQIQVEAPGHKADLVAALTADDQS